jgi:hypothetical protein
MSAAAAENPQRDFALRVDVTRTFDGATFVLHPLSSDDLRWLVPEAHQYPRIFIAKESQRDFEELDLSLRRHIAELLTGLSVERLQALNVRLVFMDTRSKGILGELPPT